MRTRRQPSASETAPLVSQVIVAGAAAAIALPTSLPFAVFAMDFGKEGAAVLSSLLSALGFCAQLPPPRPATPRLRGCNPASPGLQPCVSQAATPHLRGCSPAFLRLQPCVSQAASLRLSGAQLLSLRLLPRLQRAHGWHAVFACLAGHGRALDPACSPKC